MGVRGWYAIQSRRPVGLADPGDADYDDAALVFQDEVHGDAFGGGAEHYLAQVSVGAVVAIWGSVPRGQLEECDEFGVEGQRGDREPVDLVSCLGQNFVRVHLVSGPASC
jgi:hypothetical protein